MLGERREGEKEADVGVDKFDMEEAPPPSSPPLLLLLGFPGPP